MSKVILKSSLHVSLQSRTYAAAQCGIIEVSVHQF